MQNRTIFESVGNLVPSRSYFDLSYSKTFTCDMGELIPIMHDEMVPGDVFKIGNQSLIRLMPMVAPVMHEINQFIHYFFVPYRLLWNDKTNEELTETGSWEEFITGGEDGTFATAVPRWTSPTTTKGTLWDYFGFPTGIDPTDAYPLDFPRRAYNMIYNDYYRDENLTSEISLIQETIKKRAWRKDYFTSSLPWLQRGTAPALPISGTTSAVWAEGTTGSNYTMLGKQTYNLPATGDTYNTFNNNTVDLSSATTFDITDLRLAFQTQIWLERNARCGARYIEFLKAHFNTSPKDYRLQRPEYIGGNVNPILISEVLQTSSTDGTSPQGNLAGHGISVGQGFAGTYKAQEFGIVIGIMSIMPEAVYSQGIDRQWLRETKYDFYFPEFSNLSEQGILNAEICAKDSDGTHNTGIFGYQGRYDEMRIKKNLICGDMRDTFDYWHLARQFNPASAPTLNTSFIECDPDKRIFASESDPGLMIQFGNHINAYRPMPIQAEPSMI